MARVSKKPEQRKEEILDAAQGLFQEKGFENTSVSDIVALVGVAQGTFYYHFQSKAQVLDAIIQRMVGVLEAGLKQLAEREDLNPGQKLGRMAQEAFLFGEQNHSLLEAVHMEANAVVHEKMVKILMASTVPVVATVVSQGKDSGLFKVRHAEETTVFLVAALAFLFHEPDLGEDQERLGRMLETLEEIIIRVLGVDDFSIFSLN